MRASKDNWNQESNVGNAHDWLHCTTLSFVLPFGTLSAKSESIPLHTMNLNRNNYREKPMETHHSDNCFCSQIVILRRYVPVVGHLPLDWHKGGRRAKSKCVRLEVEIMRKIGVMVKGPANKRAITIQRSLRGE
jgi:hypothetical protein